MTVVDLCFCGVSTGSTGAKKGVIREIYRLG